MKSRIIVGISGASGTIYGLRLLQVLQQIEGIETHLIVSKAAQQVRAYETDLNANDLKQFADVVHPHEDLACSLSSGSYKTHGMVIAPCSMKSLAEIANGLSSNALTRAAAVILKERRKLVLLTRESPLTLADIENMRSVTLMGGIIAPPVPAFYNNPQSLDDIVNHTVGRTLDLFDIDCGMVKRWDNGVQS